MMVQASPAVEDIHETICTLTFASRVRSIDGKDNMDKAKAKAKVRLTEIVDQVEMMFNQAATPTGCQGWGRCEEIPVPTAYA